MPNDFITKRAHKKSRAGCKTCKTRKVKCDELQPKCSFCVKRDLTCEYLPITTTITRTSQSIKIPSPTSREESIDFSEPISTIIRSPSPPVQTSSGILSATSLRAMHFWSLFTSESIAPGSYAVEVLQLTVPQLAFENEYLLNVVLGISSLHMASLLPSVSPAEQQATTLYRAKSFAGFREALSTIDVCAHEMHSWEAALITSILLTVLCAKDYEVQDGDLIIFHWLTLYRGLSSVVDIRDAGAVMSSRVSPIFRRSLNELEIPPMVPYILYSMLENIPVDDPDFPFLSHYRKTLDLLGVLYASLLQDGLSVAYRTRINGWCSLNSREFCDLATKAKRPRAIVLLAHYMVFVKTMRGVWWVDGIADGDIKRVFKMLEPKWFPYLEVPRLALEIDGGEDLRNLLLCSVDETSTSVLKTSVRSYQDATRWYTSSPADELRECP